MNSVTAIRTAKSPAFTNLLRNFSVTATSPEKGFLSSFFEKKVEVQSGTHSDKLSDKDRIFELCTHNVKPDSLDKYIKTTENLIGFVNDNKETLHGENIGSFQVSVGDQDQFVHLWRFDGGYANIGENLKFLASNKDYKAIQKDMLPLLRSRHSQYLMKFSFWPEVELRNGSNIYELRSYHLKPGTMVEWGNYWAKAIRLRDYKHTEGYIGMFSQVGELYNVKHIWCYNGLEERRQARETVWQHQQSQWQDIVANTVPLIRKMTSRIMVPLTVSPTK
uniref:Protein nap n=1 Tax=Pseudodiaptomus poplesia TaxID=213370 RepID=A0A0U2T7R1_9MAXI|nr:protein nap [Pseudodiaptomus poplesia]